jgi:hypothetical protein
VQTVTIISFSYFSSVKVKDYRYDKKKKGKLTAIFPINFVANDFILQKNVSIATHRSHPSFRNLVRTVQIVLSILELTSLNSPSNVKARMK